MYYTHPSDFFFRCARAGWTNPTPLATTPPSSLWSLTHPNPRHSMSLFDSRLGGYALAVAAPLCWSVGGLVIRQVDAGPWEITFWRSLGHVAVFVPVLLLLHGFRTFVDFRHSGWVGCVSTLLLAGTFVLHVLAMTSTTVANVLVLQSVSPLLVAILSWFVLREAVSWSGWIAVAVAFGGIATVLANTRGGGQLVGDLWALTVAICSAMNVMLLRRYRSFNLLPVSIMAGLASMAVAGPASDLATTSLADIALLAGLGVIQFTLGLSCFILALRRLPAVEVSLVALLEPVFGPLWVWLAIGEQPAAATVLGGALVLAAVVFRTLTTASRRSVSAGQPA